MNNIFKKVLCIALSVLAITGNLIIAMASETSAQPYYTSAANCENFRIPAMITLNNGNILTSADIRYGNIWDSPSNIDTGVSISSDNGKSWSKINTVNHFYDCDDSCSDNAITKSASFIDSALLQSSEGTVFLLCDACPAFIGSSAAKKNGSGYIDGKIVLCDKTTESEAESGNLSKECYPYYIDEFVGNYASVNTFENASNYNGYYVDREFNLYKINNATMEKVMISALDADGNKTENYVQANVFYACSPVKIYPTFYTWLRTSTDNGITWSSPIILNQQIKSKGFTGICPGKGIEFNFNGKQRLAFAVYDTNDGYEKTSIIYSDDNGKTWERGEKIKAKGLAKKSSESQIVFLNENTIRIYSRNSAKYIGYADSTDGGKTWTHHFVDTSLKYCSDCMVSFINYSKTLDGKRVIIASYPSTASRKLGVIKVGLIDKSNTVDWKYEYKVTDSQTNSSYAYSCLTELPDGSIGLLYENGPAEITYINLSFDELVSKENQINALIRFFRNIFTIIIQPIAYI